MQGSILAEESPECRRMVTELLYRTLCSDIRGRYNSCTEISEVLEAFVQDFQKPKPYLKTVLPMGTNFFCGRDREISEIHGILQQETNFLILHGIGGIGKSELAKQYARRYAKEYDAVVFMRYDGNIMETVASDSKLPIVNCKRSENESDEAYFSRKMKLSITLDTKNSKGKKTKQQRTKHHKTFFVS